MIINQDALFQEVDMAWDIFDLPYVEDLKEEGKKL
jgi:hypothetical protein